MRRRVVVIGLAAIGIAAAYAATVRATPGSGFSSVTLAKAPFAAMHVENEARSWEANVETHGVSDLYVQSNTWAPGGTTGWHTHPGASFIIVTEGTVTAYEGNDPTCTPHVFSKGMGFVDPGGGHVHVLRNEGTVDAQTIAVQLIPTAAVRRIDAPAPGNCPF
jgi:uncharacterized cupin superfamily protein